MTITPDTAFALPVLVMLLALGYWGARQQARLEHMQKELDKAHDRITALENSSSSDRHRLTTAEVVLGRVDQMVSDLHKAWFQQRNKESA